MESGKRTIIKAILWNILGLLMMLLVGYLASGSWQLGGTIAFANTAVGVVCYIIYERIWAQVGWGRHVR
jgi:uncharacterized membrane protein